MEEGVRGWRRGGEMRWVMKRRREDGGESTNPLLVLVAGVV